MKPKKRRAEDMIGEIRSDRPQKFTYNTIILIISRLTFPKAKVRKRYFFDNILVEWRCISAANFIQDH